jgi:hypothetical protein
MVEVENGSDPQGNKRKGKELESESHCQWFKMLFGMDERVQFESEGGTKHDGKKHWSGGPIITGKPMAKDVAYRER